ncbi:MAG: D-alanyl-D-alanine carboxypeptidase [Parcubacteria group bacterium]|nr:D-alanyl-D-alanine carboxypeptidase [Parcubacteria group bacterium]
MKKIFIITILFFILILPANAGRNVFITDAHLSLSKERDCGGCENFLAGSPITAKSVMVIDVKSGDVILSRKPREKMPIASITKLMSLLVFIDSKINLNRVVVADDGDLKNLEKYTDEDGGDKVAQISLENGAEIRVKDAVYSGIIRSANNAVSMFVRSTGLSQKDFVKKMNDRALAFGLDDTYFTEPTGLDVNNISTAEDVKDLVIHSLKNDFVKKITSTKEYSFRTLKGDSFYEVQNTNWLLGMFDPDYYEVIGGKTGYLDECGYNVVVQVKNWEGKEVIAVVLGSASNLERFTETRDLIIKAFDKI